VIVFVGGRDRDRTCDPYHVNEAPGEETPERRALAKPASVVFGAMFRGRSAFPVRRAKGHYVARGVV
jgi:hypothetical protein